MTDKKLTDSEVVKALECCMNGRCDDDCPFRETREYCYSLDSLILDLINRLQEENENYSKNNQQMTSDILKLYKELEQVKAENERLKDYNKNLQTANTTLSNEILDTKAEAYKEFADKIYEKVGFYITETNDTLNKMLLGEIQGTSSRKHYLYGGLRVLYEINSMLNNLLKELVGEDK